MNDKLKPEQIVGAVLVTLLWAAGVGGLLFWATRSITGSIIGSVIYAVLHPIAGKLASKAIELLCRGIDWTYSIDDSNKWGNWTREKALWMAAFWPVVTPVMLVITGIGIIFGFMYKILFASD